jgi:hypothetical protein
MGLEWVSAQRNFQGTTERRSDTKLWLQRQKVTGDILGSHDCPDIECLSPVDEYESELERKTKRFVQSCQDGGHRSSSQTCVETASVLRVKGRDAVVSRKDGRD